MFGLAADEVSPALSRWHAQWLALIHPDDRARAGEVWARALDGSGRYDVEYRIRTSHDGERVIHSLAELTRDRAGRPVKAFGTMQDITAVRRAEEASRVSAAILRAFVDHTTDAFFLLDGDGVIIDVNARACDSLGYAREALLGRRPADLEVSRDAARGGDVTTPAAPDPRVASTLEAQYRRADGSTIPVELSLVSFQVEGQRFAVSMARDVTERKRAQASLQLFRALLDHSMDTIEVIEPATGRILDVNAQACRAHGYTRDEYLGLTIVDLSPQVPPARWTAIAADVEREGSIVLQDVHRRKDGSIFPVEVTSSFVRLDRDYLVAVVRDVTARRAAEDALRRSREHLDALIRTIDGVVWESDAGSRRFTFVSPQAQRLLGYPAERWLEDEGFWVEHLHPDDRGHVVAERARAVEERRDHELEYRVIAAGGGTVWLRDLVSVVREGERVVALRGIMVDVTERRRLEEQLGQSQKMEAIGQLAGGVAHDFNNILTAIIMEAELARESYEEREVVDAGLEQIRTSAERAATLTRRLLVMSRRQVLAPTTLVLDTVVRAAADMLRRLIGEDISLTLELASEARTLHADAGMLDQIILNLAVNARDAMPRGGRIHIATGTLESTGRPAHADPDAAPGPYVWLSLSDSGCGIPPELRAKVFEPFFTTKAPGRGTGLGLATVYGVVKQHRGWIELDSEVGRGTTFSVYLPCTEGRAVAEPGPAHVTSGGHETILLVEDEPAVRRATRAVLVRRGYAVLEASDGAQALELLRGAAPGTISLVLTDMVLPGGLSGAQLASLARAWDPAVRFVFASGYSPVSESHDLVVEPGTRFLQKPFAPETLLEAVRSVLDDTSSVAR
jgi:two-component system cell cycle sensor histidine kinase/response regulator CckA